MKHSDRYRQKATHLARFLYSLVICIAVTACGGGVGSVPQTGNSNNGASNNNAAPISADIKVLMMGNSHTYFSSLPARLEAMLRANHPGKTVAVVVAPASLFLDEHSKNAQTMALLRGQSWNYVILQAQKYSSSGAFSYSTSEAVNLVKIARQAGALPILFPEWPRRDVPETERIFTLHVSIAQQAPACVAPIGQAWDLALQRHPNLALYGADGNHSAAAGAQLAALMLYTTVSGKLPSSLPDIAFADVSPDIQRQLRLVADDAVAALSPRKYCPQDLPTL